jgi:hypothetical protein
MIALVKLLCLPIHNSYCTLQVISKIMSRKEALSQFIQQIHGRPVVVKLNSGVDYRGKTVKMLTNFLISSGSGMGSTQPHEDT